ncbi:hypothetical protein BGW41_005647 [Actinomortierella wolfii]|nr:hypothetical protein BGW41_005647 [Actinomortierella wolfii]
MSKIPGFVQAILRVYLPRRLASAGISEEAAKRLLQAASSKAKNTTTASTAITTGAKRIMTRSTPQQWQPCAAFSTTSCADMSNRNTYTKEEEDLYQVLISSFRERLAEQPHQPENYYNAVIQQLVSHNKNTPHHHHHHAASKARRDRIALAAQHHDLTLLQREQDEMRMENNDHAADHLCLIQGWLKCGELTRATLAFEMMESMGVFPTVRILSVLIRAHTRANNFEAAKSMIHRMTDMNLQPSSIYDMSALLEYYIKLEPTFSTSSSTAGFHEPIPILTMADSNTNNNSANEIKPQETHPVEAVWKAIETRITKDMTPSEAKNASFSYRTYLVYLVMKKRDLDTAALLIDRMALHDLWPGIERYRKTAANVIHRLLEHGFLSETKTLLLGKDAALGKVVDSAVWLQLMEAYMTRSEHQQARIVYNDMVQAQITPNEKCQRLYKTIAPAPPIVNGGDGGGSSGDHPLDVARFLSIHETRPVLV